MDPLSQGAIGASLPQSFSRPSSLRTVAWLGALSGMAPDLDSMIRSSTDPLLFLEYHRQFTHSLVFIPVGALLCASVFYFFARKQLSFAQTWLACILGYGTHALLDACTTYGTQLFWPFSDLRVAWNNISIVDPLFTLPLLALVVAASVRRRPLLARMAFGWAIFYLLFGIVQRERAESVGRELALERGHEARRVEAKAGFANLLLWKVIYEHEGRFYVDAIRAGLETTLIEGDSIAKLKPEEDFQWLEPDSQQFLDIQRFRWFSGDYLAVDPDDQNYVIDMRYSMLPHEIAPLWGIELNPEAGPGDHVTYRTSREDAPARLGSMWRMLLGGEP